MAMQAALVIEAAHMEPITALAFDAGHKVVYSAAQEPDIKAWDIKGQCLATIKAHRGWVTHLTFCEGLSLLLSGGVDGWVVMSDDRFRVLQIVDVVQPVRSLAWSVHHSVVAVGLHSTLQLYFVSHAELVQLRRHRHRQMNLEGAHNLPPAIPLTHSNTKAHAGHSAKRHAPVAPAALDGAEPQQLLLRARGPAMAGPELGHTDAVSGVVILESGLVVSVGYDRAFCAWDIDRPQDTFRRVTNVHGGAIVSLAHDLVNNYFLTGAFDGCFKIWSYDLKVLETFDGVHDDRTRVIYVPMVHAYWQLGRFGHLQVYDPRAPANITDHVAESNSLADFDVTNIWSQIFTDAVLGCTSDREIVLWRYNHFGSYRTFVGHQGFVEAMCVAMVPEGSPTIVPIKEERLVVKLKAGARVKAPSKRDVSKRDVSPAKAATAISDSIPLLAEETSKPKSAAVLGAETEVIFTACASGIVHRWALSHEQNCDLYKIEDTFTISTANILCLQYFADINSLIAAGDDCKVHVLPLNRMQRQDGDDVLPDVLSGHSKRITALEVLKAFVLVTVSHDQSMRFWDLLTMKEIEKGRITEAHQAPVVGLCYNAEADELATWALENVAKIWDVSRPHCAKVKVELQTPGEISQVRWVPWRNVWVTSSDDEAIRLWRPSGGMEFKFGYNGGPVTSMLVDEQHQLLLVGMQDSIVRTFDLLDPVPKVKYLGHTDTVRGIVYVQGQEAYATCSWDKSLRFWRTIHKSDAVARHHARVLKQHNLAAAAGLEAMSEYEKEHPLLVPRSLQAMSEYEKEHPLLVPRSLQGGKVLDLTMSLRKERVKKKKYFSGEQAEMLARQLSQLDKELLVEMQEEAAVQATQPKALRTPVPVVHKRTQMASK